MVSSADNNTKNSDSGRKVKHIMLFIIDDVRADQFFEYYDKGLLPNIARLGRKGITCRKCVTTFPSITLPTQPDIMTGAYSGYYPKFGGGIPAYHWFNREADPPIYRHYSGLSARYIYGDIGPSVRTIFEQAGEGNKISVFQLCARGADKIFTRHVSVGVLYALYYFYVIRKPELSHKIITKRIIRAFKKPEKVFGKKGMPTVAVGYFPVTDYYMHEKGYDSEIYIKTLLGVDKEIGKILDALENMGVLEETAVAVTADHGNYKAKTERDLRPFMASRNLVQYDPKKGKGDFDASFGGVGFFNFPGKDHNWHIHPTVKEMRRFVPMNGGDPIDLIDMMFDLEGVKYVYYREDGNTPYEGVIRILYKHTDGGIHEGKIEYKRDKEGKQKTRYSFEDYDMFKYSEDGRASGILDGNFHEIEEWLDATYHLDFPMIVDQLPRYFVNPRSCDIMVDTCGEVTYNYAHGSFNSNHYYGHDIALRCSMYVPLVIGGSSAVPHMELEYAKTTDIVPTLLDLLGKTPHPSVVGRSLLIKKAL